jgi:hypothetical protein
MAAIREFLYPRLRSVPSADRDALMRRARDIPFDVIELVGIASGLLIAVVVTRYSLDEAQIVERVFAALLNFLVAAPLLALLVGPFLIRRVRRGIDQELSGRVDR